MQIKTARPPQSGEPCECGLRADVAQPTCGELRDSLLARDFEQPVRYWRFHNLAIDAYCVQHAAYVKSPKSLAAHLCGLCIAFEHRGDATARQKLQRWLSTNPAIQKPELPSFRGGLTIADVYGIEDPTEYGKAVEAWARAAWDAYLEAATARANLGCTILILAMTLVSARMGRLCPRQASELTVRHPARQLRLPPLPYSCCNARRQPSRTAWPAGTTDAAAPTARKSAAVPSSVGTCAASSP